MTDDMQNGLKMTEFSLRAWAWATCWNSVTSQTQSASYRRACDARISTRARARLRFDACFACIHELL